MTTEHQVDAARPGHEVLIGNFTVEPSQMGKTDDEVALLPFQFGNHAVGGFNRVEEFHALAVLVVNKSFQLRRQSEHTDTHSVAADDDIWFHHTLYGSSREVVVGTHYGEFGPAEQTRHVLHTEVELMVTDGGGIVAHLVHQVHLHISLIERIVGRTLREVATVEEQQLGILQPFLFYQSQTAQIASPAGHCRVGQRFLQRHNAAMGVVGV